MESTTQPINYYEISDIYTDNIYIDDDATDKIVNEILELKNTTQTDTHSCITANVAPRGYPLAIDTDYYDDYNDELLNDTAAEQDRGDISAAYEQLNKLTISMQDMTSTLSRVHKDIELYALAGNDDRVYKYHATAIRLDSIEKRQTLIEYNQSLMSNKIDNLHNILLTKLMHIDNKLTYMYRTTTSSRRDIRISKASNNRPYDSE